MNLASPLCLARPGKAARNRAFTLIELLTVIAIIAILASLLYGGIQAVNRTARTQKCLSTLRQWGLAFPLYATDHDGFLPTANLPLNAGGGTTLDAWQTRIGPYVAGTSGQYAYIGLRNNFHCPGDPAPNWAYSTNNYLLTPTATSHVIHRFSDFPHPDVTLLLTEADDAGVWGATPGKDSISGMQYNRHGNGLANFMFADLHCASLTGTQAAQTSIVQFAP